MDGVRRRPDETAGGFGLIELLLAQLILAIGLLAAVPVLSLGARLTAQARSQSTAALAAQGELERLADLFRRNPAAAELAPGEHQAESPREFQNPLDGNVLDRYRMSWSVGDVPDPRPGIVLPGRAVSVRATPLLPDGEPAHDKALAVHAVLGAVPEAEP